MTCGRIILATALLLGASVTTATAERPRLTLPRGAIQVSANLELNMSADRVAKPLSISPDAAYGVSDALTVAVVHSRFATTGFRANAGGGLCLSGDDGGCVAVYNNVGGELWYDLGVDGLGIAAGLGFHALNLDAGFHAAKLGVKLRRPMGKLALHAAPSLLLAVTERDDGAGNRLNKDTLWVPVQATYRASAPLTVGLGSGVKGPLSGFADGWQLPLGFMATYAVSPELTVGASWVFGQLLGGEPPPPAAAATGFDYRGAQIWVTYTRAPTPDR